MFNLDDADLHFDGDCFLFLVDVGSLGELDVAGADVASGRKFDAFLGARNHDRFAELKQMKIIVNSSCWIIIVMVFHPFA